MKTLNVRIPEELFDFINEERFGSKSEITRKALEQFRRKVSKVDQIIKIQRRRKNESE